MRASALPIYYGWFVLAAGAVAEMLAQGATSYAAGLFVLPLQAEFHLSRADASSAILILFAGAALVSPLIGRLLDRYSVRLVMGCGALLFALSLAGIATAGTLWLMTLLLFLPGAAGFMAIGPLTTATLTSRWFRSRRGLALGIAAVATSGGGFLAPILGVVIARHGWRQGLLYEAVTLCIIIIALALVVVRDSPAAMALESHPENIGSARSATAATPEWRGFLSTADFWIPSLTLAVISGTAQATVILLVPYAVGLGHPTSNAALLLTAFAVAAAITKVLAGLLADLINQRLLLMAAALLMTLSWFTLSASPLYTALFIASCLAGTALGCALPTVTMMIAVRFGAINFGRVMGVTYFLILSLAIGAVRFSGFVYDSTGSYQTGFEIFTILLVCLLAATSLFATKRRAV